MPTIALVDDDRNILTSVSMALEAEGYRIMTYTDGASALDGFKTSPPDLAILDIKMPRMDGMETLRRLRQKSDIPVIFLTSKDEEIDEMFGLKMGADDFIRKPFSQRLLVERVKAVLRRAIPKDGVVQKEVDARALERGHLRMDPERHTCTWKNDFTDGLCLKAIQLVFEYLPKAVKDGKDMEARERMANAATLAGIGFINSLAAMAHAAGHSLGGVFHTPHGRAVGLFLPFTIEFIGDAREELWADIVRFLALDVPKGKKASAVLAQAIRGLAKSINQPLSVKELGIPQEKFNAAMEKLIDNVMADGSLIVSARVPNVAETERFFRYAYDGKSIDF